MQAIFDERPRWGCDPFSIDSLMRLGVAGDDYSTQEAVIFRIVDWATANAVHRSCAWRVRVTAISRSAGSWAYRRPRSAASAAPGRREGTPSDLLAELDAAGERLRNARR
jgi:hypothetical protein